MPLPLDEKKRGAIFRIISKKLKDGSSYDEMKRYNSEEALKKEESEEKQGLITAAEEIIRAFENRSAKELVQALENFLEIKD